MGCRQVPANHAKQRDLHDSAFRKAQQLFVNIDRGIARYLGVAHRTSPGHLLGYSWSGLEGSVGKHRKYALATTDCQGAGCNRRVFGLGPICGDHSKRHPGASSLSRACSRLCQVQAKTIDALSSYMRPCKARAQRCDGSEAHVSAPNPSLKVGIRLVVSSVKVHPCPADIGWRRQVVAKLWQAVPLG